MASPMATHEDRLANDINRCRALADQLGLLSTKHYLDIAAAKLDNERAEKTARADRTEASRG